jgi:hypothetical protein
VLAHTFISHGFFVELAESERRIKPGERVEFPDLTAARVFLAPIVADRRDLPALRRMADDLAPGTPPGDVDDLTARLAAALVDRRITFVRTAPWEHATIKAQAGAGAGAGEGDDKAAELTWIEARLLDADGTGIANQRCVVVAPDGQRHEAYTDSLGTARIDGIPVGSCKILYPDLTADACPSPTGPRPTPAEARQRFTVHDLVVGVTRTTKEVHELRLLVLSIRVRLAINPNDTSSRDDEFILHATRGSAAQKIIKTIKDDQVPGDNSVDLVYEHLWRDHRYSLEVNPGAEGEPYHVFQDVPLSQLLAL